MKKTIWKYELEIRDTQFIKMPKDANVLSVQTQGGMPVLWVLVNPANPPEEKCFEIVGTGNLVYCDMGTTRDFIGTFQMSNGLSVWHLFERLS